MTVFPDWCGSQIATSTLSRNRFRFHAACWVSGFLITLGDYTTSRLRSVNLRDKFCNVNSLQSDSAKAFAIDAAVEVDLGYFRCSCTLNRMM